MIIGKDSASTFEGQRFPFTPLPTWLRGKATALEIAVLWVLQSHYPEIRPSLGRLAEECGLARSTVAKVVSDLIRKGWLLKQQRTNENGSSAPSRYKLNVWGDTGENQAVAMGAGSVRETDTGGPGDGHQASVKRTPGVRETDGEGPGDGRGGSGKRTQTRSIELDQENYINPSPLTPLRGEPAVAGPVPISPVPCQSAPEPTHTAPQAPVIAHNTPLSPAAPSDPPKRTRDPLAGRVLPPAAVPSDLQHVAHLLAEWWAVKSRGRTTIAFNRACEMLRGYPPQQQERMLQSAVVGGWQGLHEVTSHPSSSTRRLSNSERQQQALANFCDFMAVADPEHSPAARRAQAAARPGDNAVPINNFAFLDRA